MKSVDLKELALKKVKITGNVIGKFGTFEIEQVYKNNTEEVLEVGYTFPIVETATVVGFEINVGDKVLKGKCKETKKAKEEYQRNIVKGNSAYMMEKETNNIFRISIGKIDINEEVTIKIHYIDKLEITDNKIEILIPTLVTPKYKSNTTNQLIYGNVNYSIDFNINIDKTLNIKNISCPSHKINLIKDKKYEIIEVLNYDLSKDFKLNIELKNELLSNAITSKTRDGKDMVYLSFMPEILDSYEDSEKEYIFIIDVSGSMIGRKLDETKKAVIECLKQLDEGDKFNIIPFGSRYETMSINSIDYNAENMQKAITYINNLRPLGGTEILNPLKFALYEKNTDKTILLFTDGQVGNENEIIRYVENNINKSRIFPFGIDTNVNSAFIKQLAKAGNGKAELIQPKEKIDDKIIRTFARIQTPMLEKLEIDYGTNKVIDEIKEEKCLFNYEFFNVFAKIEKLEDDIKLKGKILDKEYVWKISKEDINNTKVDLEILFAKQEIERLEEYIRNTYENDKIENYKEMIIEISEKYNIDSKYTSFITVYEREEKLLEVPKYEEIKLSDKFIQTDSIAESWDMFDVNKCYIGAPRKCSRMSRRVCFESDILQVDNSDIKILEKNVDKYYKVFAAKNEKSILTYLLYAIYYLKSGNSDFNYNKFFEFLNKIRDVIASTEIYMKLICLCYYELESNRIIDNRKLLSLLDEYYKKIALTNLKVSINLKVITQMDVKNIIDGDKIEDNIDDVLWYLYHVKNDSIAIW